MAEQTPDPTLDSASAPTNPDAKSTPPSTEANSMQGGVSSLSGDVSGAGDGVNKVVRIDYTVRRAKFDDQDLILNLLEPFVKQKKLLHRTRAEILLLMATGYVAETVSEGGIAKLIGFSAVEIYSRKLGEIQCLAVADGYHGNGIGGALVEACVELAREKGILEVMAISSSDSFLKKLGFDYSLPEQKRALFRQLHSRDEIFNSDE